MRDLFGIGLAALRKRRDALAKIEEARQEHEEAMIELYQILDKLGALGMSLEAREEILAILDKVVEDTTRNPVSYFSRKNYGEVVKNV